MSDWCMGCGGPLPCPDFEREYEEFKIRQLAERCPDCEGWPTHFFGCPHYGFRQRWSWDPDLQKMYPDHPGWSAERREGPVLIRRRG